MTLIVTNKTNSSFSSPFGQFSPNAVKSYHAIGKDLAKLLTYFNGKPDIFTVDNNSNPALRTPTFVKPPLVDKIIVQNQSVLLGDVTKPKSAPSTVPAPKPTPAPEVKDVVATTVTDAEKHPVAHAPEHHHVDAATLVEKPTPEVKTPKTPKTPKVTAPAAPPATKTTESTVTV